MSQEELQLLREAFSTMGEIGSGGFDALVRHTYTLGIVGIASGALALMAGCAGFLWWASRDADGRNEYIPVCVMAGFCALFGVATIMVNLISVVEPTGSTVRDILRSIS